MNVTRGQNYNDFAFRIGNDGNTTPNKMRTIVDCFKKDSDIKEPFDLLLWDEANAFKEIIPPKSTSDIAPLNIISHCRVPFDDFTRVVQNSEHIYFVGEIRYLDGVDKVHERVTEFAKELALDTQTLDPGYGSRAAVYNRGQHNCADDDCPK